MARRSVVVLIMVFAAFVAGCGRGGDVGGQEAAEGSAAVSAARAECGELADEVIVQIQAVVDELGDVTLDDMLQDNVLSATTQQRLDELDGRVQAAGCSEDDMDSLLADRADRIQGDGVLAEEIREGLAENGDLPF
jgi:hypothetical protein